MGAVAVDGANGEAVGSVEQMFGRFSAELIHQFPAWRKRLADQPDKLSELETDVHAACMRGADMIICGLVAIVLQYCEPEKGLTQRDKRPASGLYIELAIASQRSW